MLAFIKSLIGKKEEKPKVYPVGIGIFNNDGSTNRDALIEFLKKGNV